MEMIKEKDGQIEFYKGKVESKAHNNNEGKGE